MTNRMFFHPQVPVKVNALCDSGIAPLVLALNEIEGLRTLDSCECNDFGRANIFFEYGDDWREIADLLQTISTSLREQNIRCDAILSLEWCGNNDWPRAQMSVHPEHVAMLAEAISALATVVNCHKSQ